MLWETLLRKFPFFYHVHLQCFDCVSSFLLDYYRVSQFIRYKNIGWIELAQGIIFRQWTSGRKRTGTEIQGLHCSNGRLRLPVKDPWSMTQDSPSHVTTLLFGFSNTQKHRNNPAAFPKDSLSRCLSTMCDGLPTCGLEDPPGVWGCGTVVAVLWGVKKAKQECRDVRRRVLGHASRVLDRQSSTSIATWSPCISVPVRLRPLVHWRKMIPWASSIHPMFLYQMNWDTL